VRFVGGSLREEAWRDGRRFAWVAPLLSLRDILSPWGRGGRRHGLRPSGSSRGTREACTTRCGASRGGTGWGVCQPGMVVPGGSWVLCSWPSSLRSSDHGTRLGQPEASQSLSSASLGGEGVWFIGCSLRDEAWRRGRRCACVAPLLSLRDILSPWGRGGGTRGKRPSDSSRGSREACATRRGASRGGTGWGGCQPGSGWWCRVVRGFCVRGLPRFARQTTAPGLLDRLCSWKNRFAMFPRHPSPVGWHFISRCGG
jgi:hypothetical protein